MIIYLIIIYSISMTMNFLFCDLEGAKHQRRFVWELTYKHIPFHLLPQIYIPSSFLLQVVSPVESLGLSTEGVPLLASCVHLIV